MNVVCPGKVSGCSCTGFISRKRVQALLRVVIGRAWQIPKVMPFQYQGLREADLRDSILSVGIFLSAEIHI